MTDHRPVELISQAFGFESTAIHSMSVSPWSTVCRVESASHPPYVAKTGPFEILNAERQSLLLLRATNTVPIPELLGFEMIGNQGVLLLESLKRGSRPDWSRFAADLAALHRPGPETRYGFTIDTYLGSTLQVHSWCDDWIDFNRCFRHGPLLQSVNLGEKECALVESAVDSFTDFLGQPRPGLIHGDLWSGNAIPLIDGSVALIDPAPSYGDPLADIAMMKLFGGFPETFFDLYHAESGIEPEERTLAAYRLYHALNHLRLFGQGYRSMVLREARLILDG